MHDEPRLHARTQRYTPANNTTCYDTFAQQAAHLHKAMVQRPGILHYSRCALVVLFNAHDRWVGQLLLYSVRSGAAPHAHNQALLHLVPQPAEDNRKGGCRREQATVSGVKHESVTRACMGHIACVVVSAILAELTNGGHSEMQLRSDEHAPTSTRAHDVYWRCVPPAVALHNAANLV
jgi:hypothetical protein